EFGVYVYALTWLLLFGGLVDFGLAASSQYFIPKYTERRAIGHLHGYLAGSRWLSFGLATLLAIIGALCIRLLDGKLDQYMIAPLYLACLTLPIFGVMNVQDGIARSYNWPYLALMPHYIIRQALLIALMAAIYVAGYPTDAVTAVILVAVTIWVTTLGQMLVLNRRLRAEVPREPARYEPRQWFSTAFPIFMIDGLYLMFLYVDVLVLNEYRSPEDVAVYFAAVKTLSLVAFVYFAVTAAAAHKFTQYHVSGDRERLAAFLASSIRWTFWPSLVTAVVILAIGWPLLWLFGARFVAGYHLMFILAIGLLARASVGPGERVLNMLGEQRTCMLVAAVAALSNIVLCILLIPRFGAEGAAVSTSAAFVVESILLFIAIKHRLGFHMFIWSKPVSA
ncbi:MAG: polysaccharide biosynthesis C-terminal domain-containing protein, partial [Rhizobiales bacterium]|nr:polysaccharide biosynthesis C-terminal domain-containing protein [Hyphomicrobiales bacterium]